MNIFKNTFNILLVVLIVGAAYYYRDRVTLVGKRILNDIVPCTIPITYSLGDFDENFNIDKTKFLSSINQAEKVWENEADKELFRYVETGGMLKIHLIYDQRQVTTDALKKIGVTIDNTQASYDELKTRYTALNSVYEEQKKRLSEKSQNLKTKQVAYEKEVAYWNSRGGAPESEYSKLQEKRTNIDNSIASFQSEQAAFNKTVKSLNTLASAMNQLIAVLNLNVEKFNTVSHSNGEEFEEGEYVRDISGERINIYEFDGEKKLLRVLTHELGHALGLSHVEDEKAIMYRLNQGTNEKLAEADITELTTICHRR